MSAVRASQTQSYRELASDYDRQRFSGAHGRFLFETDRRIIRALIGEAAPRRVLDVPTGTGRVLAYLSGTEPDVVGLDYTREMLEQARAVAQPTHTLVTGNAAQLPFADGTFDCLVSLRFFHLFRPREREAFAREFHRVVRPGGYLVISFTNGWYGGGLNWLKRAVGRPTVQFEYPGEVRRLFPEFRIRRRMGNFMPMQWRLKAAPPIARVAQLVTEVFPGNRLCWERFYLLQRSGGTAPRS